MQFLKGILGCTLLSALVASGCAPSEERASSGDAVTSQEQLTAVSVLQRFPSPSDPRLSWDVVDVEIPGAPMHGVVLQLYGPRLDGYQRPRSDDNTQFVDNDTDASRQNQLEILLDPNEGAQIPVLFRTPDGSPLTVNEDVASVVRDDYPELRATIQNLNAQSASALDRTGNVQEDSVRLQDMSRDCAAKALATTALGLSTIVIGGLTAFACLGGQAVPVAGQAACVTLYVISGSLFAATGVAAMNTCI